MHRYAVRAVVFGTVTLFAAFSAVATPRTWYDVSTHTWITYDPDKVRMGAVGPAQRIQRTPSGQSVVVVDRNRKVDPKFDKQEVAYDTTEKPGTVIIDTKNKFLYYVEEGGRAIRMGVGVGREGFGWTGTVHVGNKQENPKWFPPPEMVQRQPELKKYADNCQASRMRSLHTDLQSQKRGEASTEFPVRSPARARQFSTGVAMLHQGLEPRRIVHSAGQIASPLFKTSRLARDAQPARKPRVSCAYITTTCAPTETRL
jgi:hypothetical protein